MCPKVSQAGGDAVALNEPDLKRGARKRAAIIAAAQDVFLVEGYSAASVDRIAAKAGVSKATIYNHFTGKAALFASVVESLYAKAAVVSPPMDEGARLPETLRAFIADLLERITKPEIIGILRLVIAENRRFPELTALFYAHGKEPALRALERLIEDRTASGELVCDDARLAAQQLLGACKETLFWPVVIGKPVEGGQDRVIESAVKIFLNAYARK